MLSCFDLEVRTQHIQKLLLRDHCNIFQASLEFHIFFCWCTDLKWWITVWHHWMVHQSWHQQE